MPRWDKITPALYGITNKIAIPIIQQKWDHIIVPVLRNERIIYQGVFDAYAITQARFLNAACGIEIFLTFVKHNGFSFVQDPIEIPLEQAPLPNSVFEVYWQLAENHSYWQTGHYSEFGRHISYPNAIQKWDLDNQLKIRRTSERLDQWLNGT